MARMKRIDADAPPDRVFEWHGNTFVGRGLHEGLSLDENDDAARQVSQLHAVLVWNPRNTRWEVRDLGSINGTQVDGSPLPPGRTMALTEDTTLGFGSTRWMVSEIGPPSPRARCTRTNEVRVATDGVLLLPDELNPELRIVHGAFGWVACLDDDIDAANHSMQLLAAGSTFEAGNRQWTLWLPSAAPAVTQKAMGTVKQIQLTIDVSRDQERIGVTAEINGVEHTFGPRRHHDLLWLLARARVDDLEDGHDTESAGWRTNSAIAAQTGLGKDDPFNYLNVLVHRCRRQFDGCRLRDTAPLIERDKSGGRLRIGIPGAQLRIINRGRSS